MMKIAAKYSFYLPANEYGDDDEFLEALCDIRSFCSEICNGFACLTDERWDAEGRRFISIDKVESVPDPSLPFTYPGWDIDDFCDFSYAEPVKNTKDESYTFVLFSPLHNKNCLNFDFSIHTTFEEFEKKFVRFINIVNS